MTPAAPMGPIEWVLLLTLSVLWGGSFFFNALALDGFDPFTVVMWRVTIAGLILWAWLKLRGQALPSGWPAWRAFLVMGAINNLLPFTLIAWGQTRIDSGLASIFNATTPLFTVLLAHVLTRDERLSWNKALGVLSGLAGVVVLIGPRVPGGVDGEALGEAAVLAGAVSYAFAGIFGKRLAAHPPTVSAAAMLLSAAVLAIPSALLFGDPLAGIPGTGPLIGIAGLGVVSTTFAYIIYFRVLASAGATNLLLVTLLVPVSAVLLGATVLGESLSGRAVAGMALIGIGIAAVDGRWLNRRGH